jgi:hypothetical protein
MCYCNRRQKKWEICTNKKICLTFICNINHPQYAYKTDMYALFCKISAINSAFVVKQMWLYTYLYLHIIIVGYSKSSVLLFMMHISTILMVESKGVHGGGGQITSEILTQ